jgi:L,D-transpeptidase YbiS
MAEMKKWIFLSIAVAIVVLVLVVIVYPKQGFQWNEPAPSADSLALQAQKKLEGKQNACTEGTVTPAAVRRPGRKGKPKDQYIVIDSHTNRLYLRTPDSVLFSALCSTGTGASLVDSGKGRVWRFETPKGLYRIDSRLTDPWWRKPDWAFIEEGEPIPKKEADRLDPNIMGDYAVGFGDGFFIHGTIYERLIGVAVTHGCVRMRSDDIKHIYESAPVGTPVIIF